VRWGRVRVRWGDLKGRVRCVMCSGCRGRGEGKLGREKGRRRDGVSVSVSTWGEGEVLWVLRILGTRTWRARG
jgi:hypothetical protein